MVHLGSNVTGELWADKEDGSGGVVHLGTFHMDRNVFEVAPQDGIQGDEFSIPSIAGTTITVKGTWKLRAEDFYAFRIRWLRQRFPNLFWN